VTKNAANLAKHGNHLGNIFVRRLFKANLPVNAVVTKAEIRRACHAAVNRRIGQRLEHVAAITIKDANAHAAFSLSLMYASLACVRHSNSRRRWEISKSGRLLRPPEKFASHSALL